jgi:hypothetical protein
MRASMYMNSKLSAAIHGFLVDEVAASWSPHTRLRYQLEAPHFIHCPNCTTEILPQLYFSSLPCACCNNSFFKDKDHPQ